MVIHLTIFKHPSMWNSPNNQCSMRNRAKSTLAQPPRSGIAQESPKDLQGTAKDIPKQRRPKILTQALTDTQGPPKMHPWKHLKRNHKLDNVQERSGRPNTLESDERRTGKLSENPRQSQERPKAARGSRAKQFFCGQKFLVRLQTMRSLPPATQKDCPL